MDIHKERFFHAQAAKLDLRRRWQCMAIWPIIARFGDRLKMECEYQHGQFKIDLFIPALKLAVEIDEPFHDRQHQADMARESHIVSELQCEFIRLKVKDEAGLFSQVESLCNKIQRRIELSDPPKWVVLAKLPGRLNPARDGGYSQQHLQSLNDNRIPERVEEMKKDLASLEIEVVDDLGPIVPSNGELGFTVMMPEITFCLSIRASQQVKMLVTQHSETVLRKLGITLDGPKKGKVPYWTIKEVEGRFDIDFVTGKLATYRQLVEE